MVRYTWNHLPHNSSTTACQKISEVPLTTSVTDPNNLLEENLTAYWHTNLWPTNSRLGTYQVTTPGSFFLTGIRCLLSSFWFSSPVFHQVKMFCPRLFNFRFFSSIPLQVGIFFLGHPVLDFPPFSFFRLRSFFPGHPAPSFPLLFFVQVKRFFYLKFCSYSFPLQSLTK